MCSDLVFYPSMRLSNVLLIETLPFLTIFISKYFRVLGTTVNVIFLPISILLEETKHIDFCISSCNHSIIAVLFILRHLLLS